MKVHHDPEAREFHIATESGKAFLQYEEPDDRTLDLIHTVVPAPERKQGIGSDLVAHAIAYARENGKMVIPSCPFVKAWLAEHPQHGDLVRSD